MGHDCHPDHECVAMDRLYIVMVLAAILSIPKELDESRQLMERQASKSNQNHASLNYANYLCCDHAVDRGSYESGGHYSGYDQGRAGRLNRRYGDIYDSICNYELQAWFWQFDRRADLPLYDYCNGALPGAGRKTQRKD